MFNKKPREFEIYRKRVKHLHINLQSEAKRIASSEALEEYYSEMFSILGSKGWQFVSSVFLPTPATKDHDVEIVTFQRNDLHPLFKKGTITSSESSYLDEVLDNAREENLEALNDT